MTDYQAAIDANLARIRQLFAEAEDDTIVGPPLFLRDWPAEDWPEAVDDCIASLRRNLPRRNLSISHRWSAHDQLEQARYLGLKRIGKLPPTVERPKPAPRERAGQLDLLEGTL
jgi:hypothetical protein